MRPGLKLILITLPLALIGVAILAYVISTRTPPDRHELSERASPVRVITAESYQVAPALVGFGVVAPARTYQAIAEVGGTVDFVNPLLRDGQILPAGSVLLRLSPVDFNLAIAQAKANIRAAEARLAELDVSEANQRAALKIELEALELKAAEVERANTLFAAGTMTQTARDSIRAAHLAQRQKVQGVESTLALLPTQRAAQIEQIALYQANLATAELNLDRSEITLPFAARVASHSVEVGQFLNKGQSAATLDGVDQAEVVVQAAMSDFRNLVLNRPNGLTTLPMDPAMLTDTLHELRLQATVRLRLGDEVLTWPAIVDRISDGIDPKTGTVGLVVQINDAYGQAGNGNRPPLTKGMFVDVVLRAEPITGIVLPRDALRDGHVFVADADNRLRRIRAEPKLVQGDIALFADTIEQGSRIVLTPPVPTIDGALLDPHPDTQIMDRLLAEDAAQ
ncbi:hypothetical protein GCM10016455_31550 [Aliiroseovarius zhejiangensis]|uniref:HlyD family efflux transporter periplasmic adaptor subunit n=1 Tax=Aliiroseovarius zhejiangensis TaxID=1632025 RepID=A0ABQ3JBC2_9RHOB|nr:hypothetical protein [Aliiroseovarius zhejiangensis]GHF08201.1 hypothetical protein GCM10016455_31550 [Aliiroseovarius zhejiangensis]